MKMNKLSAAAITIIIGFCSVNYTFAQNNALEKFGFMIGDFAIHSEKGKFDGKYNKEKDKVIWSYDYDENKKDLSIVSYNDTTKKYEMVIYHYSKPSYYEGTETADGPIFKELTEKRDGLKEKGQEVHFFPVVKDEIFVAIHYRSNYDRGTEYEERLFYRNLTPENRKAYELWRMKKLEFLVGTLFQNNTRNKFQGKFTDNGEKFIWTFKRSYESSVAVISYNFEENAYEANETITPSSGKIKKVQHFGFINKGTLILNSIDDKFINRLKLSSPEKGKISFDFTFHFTTR